MARRRSTLSRNQKLTLLIATLAIAATIIAAFISGHDWFQAPAPTEIPTWTPTSTFTSTATITSSPTQTSTGAATPKIQYFPYPVSDEYRIDWCYESARDCGLKVAMEWCKRQGYSQVVDFTKDTHVGEKGIITKKLGTGDFCDHPICDSFKSITCQ